MNPARILQEMGKGTAEDGLGGGVKAGAKSGYFLCKAVGPTELVWQSIRLR